MIVYVGGRVGDIFKSYGFCGAILNFTAYSVVFLADK